ncbi:MAG: hypothetical protein F4230_10060, partial [Holophagales bacterium]|nr:hypothetical protein [Holophagales bacterium]
MAAADRGGLLVGKRLDAVAGENDDVAVGEIDLALGHLFEWQAHHGAGDGGALRMQGGVHRADLAAAGPGVEFPTVGVERIDALQCTAAPMEDVRVADAEPLEAVFEEQRRH